MLSSGGAAVCTALPPALALFLLRPGLGDRALTRGKHLEVVSGRRGAWAFMPPCVRSALRGALG